VSEFSTSELAGMQQTQEDHMMDRCTVDAYAAGATDDYGNPVPTWTPGAVTRCGYQPVKLADQMDLSKVPAFDATLRLPINTAIDPRDRITMTQRHGVAVTPFTLEIVGEPKRGPSGLVLELRKVTDG
jgi:hypothetical protein